MAAPVLVGSSAMMGDGDAEEIEGGRPEAELRPK